jgi:hypothetical protein
MTMYVPIFCLFFIQSNISFYCLIQIHNIINVPIAPLWRSPEFNSPEHHTSSAKKSAKHSQQQQQTPNNSQDTNAAGGHNNEVRNIYEILLDFFFVICAYRTRYSMDEMPIVKRFYNVLSLHYVHLIQV